jgi:hypothetical protein
MALSYGDRTTSATLTCHQQQDRVSGVPRLPLLGASYAEAAEGGGRVAASQPDTSLTGGDGDILVGIQLVVTCKVVTLGAELEDGTVIRGQNNISHPDVPPAAGQGKEPWSPKYAAPVCVVTESATNKCSPVKL